MAAVVDGPAVFPGPDRAVPACDDAGLPDGVFAVLATELLGLLAAAAASDHLKPDAHRFGGFVLQCNIMPSNQLCRLAAVRQSAYLTGALPACPAPTGGAAFIVPAPA